MVESLSLQKILTLRASECDLIGNRAFIEVTKVLSGAPIQNDLCPHKKGKFGHRCS